MIDFIKLNVSYLSDNERNEIILKPEFNCKQRYNVNTGELLYPIEGVYKDTIKIIINPKRMEINGSLHQLKNVLTSGKKHNYNDFSISDIIDMVYHLKEKFNLTLEKTIIENLEFGVNIKCSISPEKILTNHLIVWDGNPPSKNLRYSNKGKYIEFEESQSSMKIYSKSRQENLPYHLMRIEYKAICNQSVRKLGFRVLSDLIDVSRYDKAISYLESEFDKTIIVDTIDSNRIIDRNDRRKFIKAVNPLVWANFDNNDKDRKAKERLKKDMSKIIEKYGINTIKKELVNNLNQKVNELIKCHKFHDIGNIGINTKSRKNIMSQFQQNIYLKNVTLCKITGIDISHQEENKKYILGTSIRELKEKDFNSFEILIKRYKTKNWVNFTNDQMINEIAHRVRRNYQTLFEKKRKYQSSLFPL